MIWLGVLRKLRNGIVLMDGSKSTLEETRTVDWLFWVYNTITLIFLILMGKRIENRWLFAFSNLALILISLLFIRFKVNGFSWSGIRILRNGYPYLFFFYLHWESGMIRKIFHALPFDPVVQQWDLAIFGVHPHSVLSQFQPLWFTELIHFGYFFYYILMLLPAILFYRKDLTAFRRFLFDISLLYLIHYFIFYAFPVHGPIEHHYNTFTNGILFEPIMKIIYSIGDSPGGAMPSSHVSIAVLSWCWLLVKRKRLALILAPLVLCLVFSTVYLSYHYAIDAIVGVAFGLLFFILMQWLRAKYPKVEFI